MSCEGSGCPAPSWDDFRTHFFICTAAWMGLTIVGLVASAARHLWDVERVSSTLQPICIVFKEEKFYHGLMALLSSIMCFLYVLYAGGDTVFSWGKTLEEVTCYIHSLEVLCLYLFNCAQSQEDIMSFATTRLFSDCFVCVSVLARGKIASSYFSFSFVAALRVRNLWMTYEQLLSVLDKGFNVKLLHEGIQLSARIFVFAAVMRNLESFTGEPWMHQNWEPWETATSPDQVWTTSSSIYFVLCTLSTVGYGDMQPRSIIGQVLLIFVIVGGLGLVLHTVVQLIEIFQHANRGGGEYRVHSASRMRRHVVIVGSPNANTLQELLEELYHDDHWLHAVHMDSIIMMLPGTDQVRNRVYRWLHRKENRRLLGKIYMLQGSPLHWRDLDRAKLDSACLGIVLPNVQAGDIEREDIENGMRALSMNRHTPYVRLVALLLQVEYRDMFLSAGLTRKDILCVDEMKLGIMGKACDAQGFVTLVCNLFKSAGEFEEDGSEEAYVGDYNRGKSNEIYEVRMSVAYRGAPLGEVAIDILKRSESKAYLIGIIDESRYPGEDPIIRMHPGRNYRLGFLEDYVLKGIFIAPDREVIKQHPPDKPFSWHLDAGGKEEPGGAMSTVPGQVPDDTDILEKMAQRWLHDPKVVKREFEERTHGLMTGAAEKCTVQCLKNVASAPKTEIEEIMEKQIGDDLWANQELSTLEDSAGDAQDPLQKALLQQQASTARTEEKQKQKKQAERLGREEAKMRRAAQSIEIRAQKEVEAEEDQNMGNEKTIDTMLWGGPQTPRKPLHGNAHSQEPPPAVLIRGEHIVMMALEGNEDTMASGGVSGDSRVEAFGTKLGLEHFMNALRAEVPMYAQRPVVVLSQRVPYDWPKVVAKHKDVYLITGRPLATENLEMSGIRHAKALLIYQRGAVTTADPTLVDAQAIFATVLAESLLNNIHKDLLCIIDLNLHENSYLVCPEDGGEATPDTEAISAKAALEILEKQQTDYVNTKRFMSGQLFASGQAITSLLANMLYNPALGSLVLEMLSCRFVVVPIPPEFIGHTFQELYEHQLRRRNLIAIALLRRFDEKNDDQLTEDQERAEDKGIGYAMEPEPRYDPKESTGFRYVFTMPSGERRISLRDGVICVVPTGDAVCFVD